LLLNTDSVDQLIHKSINKQQAILLRAENLLDSLDEIESSGMKEKLKSELTGILRETQETSELMHRARRGIAKIDKTTAWLSAA
jgi:hypothetical protein